MPVADSKIAAIRTTTVNIPFRTPYRWAPGLYGGLTRVIVEVEDSSGAVGLGEAPHWRREELIRDEIAPVLIGTNPFELVTSRAATIPAVFALANTDTPDVLHAFGGVEMALWDLQAKILGVPLCSLYGGAVRDTVPFTEYFAPRIPPVSGADEVTPVELARYCARMRETYGSTSFEGKLGYEDVATDVAVVREVRTAIGDDVTLRVDANMGWTLATAMTTLGRLENYHLDNIEDPVGSFEEMALLRPHTRVPFSTHVPDLRRAAGLGVPNSFVLNLASLGGVAATRRFIAACEEMRIGFWFYSGDTGVATAHYLHLTAAEPWLVQPHQSLLRWYSDDVIASGPFAPRGGALPVPSGPGIGVELDRTAVARCHERFRQEGPIPQLRALPGSSAYLSLPRY